MRTSQALRAQTTVDLSSIVKLAQNGDEKAISELVEFFQKDLLRFCIYLSGNSLLGQDLCQDTFIRALENLKQLKDPAKIKSWLFQTAKNHFLNHVKSPKNAAADEIDSIDEPIGLSTDAELSLAVQNTLSKLEIEERLVILIVDLEENSYTEAAETLGVTEAAVRSRLHRARQNFMKLYSKK